MELAQRPPRGARRPAADPVRGAGRPVARPRVPAHLRDDPRFRRFWAGQSISLFGDQVSLIALPLVAVLVLDAEAAQMGYLVAAELMPNLFFSLHAGALVGGALGTWIGLRETLWIATAGALLGVLWLLPSPILGLRELPEQPLAQFGGSAGADPPTR